MTGKEHFRLHITTSYQSILQLQSVSFNDSLVSNTQVW